MQEKSCLPMPIRASPYQHQRDAFAFACRQFGLGGYEARSQGTALLMEMGTGKTITSIAIAGALYLSDNIRRVLVVAPLSILGVWDEEFAKFADFNYANSKEDYDAVVDEIYRLRKLKQDTLEHNAERHTKRQRVQDMADFLERQIGEITEYDDKQVRQLVEKVLVCENKFTVTFKSGLEVEI